MKNIHQIIIKELWKLGKRSRMARDVRIWRRTMWSVSWVFSLFHLYPGLGTEKGLQSRTTNRHRGEKKIERKENKSIFLSIQILGKRKYNGDPVGRQTFCFIAQGWQFTLPAAVIAVIKEALYHPNLHFSTRAPAGRLILPQGQYQSASTQWCKYPRSTVTSLRR